MNSPDVESIARMYLESLERYDIEAAHALIADDAVIHVNGRNVLSGTFSSKAHFQQTCAWVFREFDAGIDLIRCHDLLVSERRAVALVEERAHREEQAIEFRRVLVLLIERAQISEIWMIAEDPYALDAFWE